MAKTESKKRELEIKVDAERLQDEVTIDTFIAMQEGDLKAIRNVLGMFVVNGSGFLPYEEGVAIVGQLTINQLMAANQEFMAASELGVVPKGSKGV